MIEPLSNFPENVVACAFSGRITRADYIEGLVPAVEATLRRGGKIRVYYQIDAGFTGFDPGAMWEDFKVGVGHFSRWERIAVVTDLDWIRHAVGFFGVLMPAEVRVFPTAAGAEARSWIVANDN